MINPDEIAHKGARTALADAYRKELNRIAEATKHQLMADAPETMKGIGDDLGDARVLYQAWQEMGEWHD